MGAGPLLETPQTAVEPQLQMNATSATDIDALSRCFPGDPASILAWRLAATQVCDHRNMLGKA
jgi:hypothetical protein